MARNSRNIAVIQWDASRVSVLRVQPDRDRFAVLEHVSVRPGGVVDGAAIRRCVEPHGLEDALIYSVLPREECTVRFVTLPSTDSSELEGMVGFAAEELVPLRPDEVLVTHRVLDETDDGQTRVMICVAPVDRIRHHLDTLVAAGLEIEQILLSTDCLLEAVRETSPGSCLAVDAGEIRADMMLLENGVPVLDKAWISTAGDAQADLAHDIRRFVSTSRPSPEEPLDVLLGGGAEAVRALEDRLHRESLSVGAGLERVGEVMTEGREHLKGLPLVMLGAAKRICREGAALPGLMLSEEIHRRNLRSRRRALAWLSSLAAAALLAAGLAFGQAVQQRTAYIATLESEIADLGPEADSVSAKRKQLNRLSRAVDHVGNPLDALAVILEQSPASGLNLSHYRYDARNGIEINGRALDLPYVDAFLDNLSRGGAESIAAFAKASEIYRTERTELNRKVWDYKIAIPFESEADEEGEAR